MFLILLAVSCTTPPIKSPLIESTISVADISATVLILSSTPIITNTPQLTPTQTKLKPTQLPLTSTPTPMRTSIPTQEVISPQLKMVCPEQQVVKFEEMDIPENIILLLLPGNYDIDSTSLLALSLNDSAPRPILSIENNYPQVSADQRWILFYRSSDIENYHALWISSADGKEQWQVMQLPAANYAAWSADQELLIIGSPNAENMEEVEPWQYMPYLSINPFTLEQQSIEYLAGDRRSGLYYYGSVNSQGRTYGMYGKLNRVDFLYDFLQDEKIPAFQWLDEVNLYDLQKIPPVWVYDGDKFIVTVARPDGLDLKTGLDIHSAGEGKVYAEVMRKILIPEHLLPLYMLGLVPCKDRILLQRANFYDSTDVEPNWLYGIDFEEMIILDYCYALPGTIGPVSYSPEGRFVAFSLVKYTEPLEQDRYYVAVFDLEKGTVAYLKGFTVVDWGLINDLRR